MQQKSESFSRLSFSFIRTKSLILLWLSFGSADHLLLKNESKCLIRPTNLHQNQSSKKTDTTHCLSKPPSKQRNKTHHKPLHPRPAAHLWLSGFPGVLTSHSGLTFWAWPKLYKTSARSYLMPEEFDLSLHDRGSTPSLVKELYWESGSQMKVIYWMLGTLLWI